MLKRLAAPLIVIVLGVMIITYALAIPKATTARPSWQDPYGEPPTPFPTFTQAPYEPPDTTETAIDTTSETAVVVERTTVTPQTVVTPTTQTAEVTKAPTTSVPTDTPVLDDEEPLVTLTQEMVVLDTPTPLGRLVCAPNDPVEITGTGPALAAFLLYFGERAVSGGTVDADGNFAIKLIVGRERPGPHVVSVRLRGDGTLLRELICDVPYPPTPTPMRGQPSR
jgi:hypothetical protein